MIAKIQWKWIVYYQVKPQHKQTAETEKVSTQY